jgi:hypothetical protein
MLCAPIHIGLRVGLCRWHQGGGEGDGALDSSGFGETTGSVRGTLVMAGVDGPLPALIE